MRKLIQSSVLFFLVSVAVYGQATPLVAFSVENDPPVGTQCSAFGVLEVNKNNGNMWTCPITTHVWTQENGGGGSTTPGGAPNSIQVNNAGAFGGVLNASGTKGYLTQTSGAAATFQLVPIPTNDGGSGSPGGLTGVLQGNASSPFTATPIGNPLTYLRSKPNVTATILEFALPRVLEVPDYNFPAIAPGGTLSAGVQATVTLPYAPLGVNGIDVNHYLRISGGTGTAEAVLITGGTCLSGTIGNCTLQFTPANAHSGAFIVTSSSDGIQEAVNVSFATGSYAVHAPSANYNLYAPVAINIVGQRTQTFYGDGQGYYNNIAGTIITNNGTGPGFSLVGDLVNNACEAEMNLRNFTLHGSPTSGTGIQASNACMLRLDHIFQVESRSYGFSCTPNCYTLEVKDSKFYSNGLDGAFISSAVNEVHFEFAAFQANCRQAAGTACNGLTITSAGQNALAVSVTKSGFALDGMLPIGGFPSSSYGASVIDVKAFTYAENYCEQVLTGCLHVGNPSRGVTISGNYMQQGGISIDAGVSGIVVSGNHLTSGSAVQTITNVANNGGFCQITISAAPTNGPYTIGSFVGLTGIGGATACNDTPFDTAAVVQSVTSSTVFTTGRPFSGTYTSGGSAERAGGYFIGGSAGYSDAHVFGNSLNTSDGDVLTIGGDLLPGFGSTLLTASVITPLYQTTPLDDTVHVPVATIVSPSGYAGQACFISGFAVAFVTGGNIAANFTMTPNQQHCFNYYPPNHQWH